MVRDGRTWSVDIASEFLNERIFLGFLFDLITIFVG